MTYYECTPEKQKEIEGWVRERAEKNGFDPDQFWAWWLKTRDPKAKPKMGELMQFVLDESKRRGWLDECNLDYEAHAPDRKDDFPVPGGYCYNGDFRFTPNYGSNEGIYLDWHFRTLNDGEWQYKYLGAFKTLGESFESAEKMGRLAGRLEWLTRFIYP